MCIKHVENGFTPIQNETGKFWVFCFRTLPKKDPFAPPPPHTHGLCLQAADRAAAPIYTIYTLYTIYTTVLDKSPSPTLMFLLEVLVRGEVCYCEELLEP